MDALLTVLGRERVLAELVVFKLLELRQLLLAGEARFLPWAAEEVERATDALRRTELDRAVVVRGVAADRGLPGDVRLAELLEHVGEPWRSVLVEHAEALRSALGEAAELTAAGGRAAETGLRGVTDLLHGAAAGAAPDDGLRLYGPAGAAPAPPRPRVAQSL